jgi:hypothetical protein
MAYLSLTRMKLRSPVFLPIFITHSLRIFSQLRKVPGLIIGKAIAASDLSMWTATLWESEATLHQFYRTGAHHQAAQFITQWASEAVQQRLTVSSHQIPSWKEAAQILTTTGHFYTLNFPSRNHLDHTISAPTMLLWSTTIYPNTSLQGCGQTIF